MALAADRYTSRADTLVFLGCVLLSLAAMGLPDRVRDPFAGALQRTVLAPFLALQRQTDLVSASLQRYDAVVAQRAHRVVALERGGDEVGLPLQREERGEHGPLQRPRERIPHPVRQAHRGERQQ